jgi:hypothetical protein
MVFTDVIKAVDQLSADQLRQLREYIQQREQQIELKAGTLNMAQLLEGLEGMRAGLTEEEFREIERAMNDESLEMCDCSDPA